MKFQADYRFFADVMRNVRPARLPIYEHLINPPFMEPILGVSFADLAFGKGTDLAEFFRQYCRFYREMTYDTVSFEVCIVEYLPGSGALTQAKPGPIQSRADFDAYPWDDLPKIFWEDAGPKFDALIAALPPGMKAVGGVGNGPFETAEDLVGLTYLPYMQADEPELYADLFNRIGTLMATLWETFLDRYADAYVACRVGDDLGFKTSLLTNPSTVHENIVPQYRRVIKMIHAAGKPFLWHSCGCIFLAMDAMIDAGINAKHSNEDIIAPFSRWIADYGGRIALVGGFDLGFLCQSTPDEITSAVIEKGGEYRATAHGYALGSGNSIPEYVPVENYLAMIEGARILRERETVEAK
jgi:uroporphyrinogen decarboxylase